MISAPEPQLPEDASELALDTTLLSVVRTRDDAQVISPWLEPDFFGPKPTISEYGFISNGQPVACETLFKLRSYVVWDKADKIKQVWVELRDDQLTNGGVNIPPRTWDNTKQRLVP